MPITIGSNIASLRAQRKLSVNTAKLGTVFERLSSGQRINKASDDAASLAIAESLTTDARVYTQAIRNVNDGVSALNIAQGALEQLTVILIRQKELATQSANGSYSLEQRRSLNIEANALVDEFNRIVESAEFNGRKLLDPNAGDLWIQAGYGLDGAIRFGLSDALARTVGDGTFQDYTSYDAGSFANSITGGDLNGDGITDLAVTNRTDQTISVLLGNGNGTFRARSQFNAGPTPVEMTIGDFNGDGVLDLVNNNDPGGTFSVLLGNGNGTFQALVSFSSIGNLRSVATGDFNGDGNLDLVGPTSGDTVNTFLGNGNGTFQADAIYNVGSAPEKVAVQDLNGDGVLDLAVNNTGDDTLSILLGMGDGTFETVNLLGTGSQSSPAKVMAGDFNGDGAADLVLTEYGDNQVSIFLGKGDGNFDAKLSFDAGTNPRWMDLGDFNGDGITDLTINARADDKASILLGNGDGTFNAKMTFTNGITPYSITTADLNGDGVLDMAVSDSDGGGAVNILLGNSTETATIARLNLNTQAEALDAMSVIDQGMNRVAQELAGIGATQSRFEVAISNLENSRDNYLAAHSQIVDADIATDSAEMIRTKILQQAATAVLGQANQQPALVLALLN